MQHKTSKATHQPACHQAVGSGQSCFIIIVHVLTAGKRLVSLTKDVGVLQYDRVARMSKAICIARQVVLEEATEQVWHALLSLMSVSACATTTESTENVQGHGQKGCLSPAHAGPL